MDLATLGPGQIQFAGRELAFRPPDQNGHHELGLDDPALVRAFGSADDYLHAVQAHFADLPLAREILRISHPWINLLSPGFSRKIQRHAATLALLFTFHNFATVDPVRRVSPAMAAGITDHVWDVSEIAGLVK